ncbi:MAG: CHAT domain-containing protein [Lyngbya sp. HA4199-MV5]|jgi:filamentous hemagglutinin family protein|nr:CHAT domain-containing protein [Lyngbya sp. HA4199-MV5]
MDIAKGGWSRGFGTQCIETTQTSSLQPYDAIEWKHAVDRTQALISLVITTYNRERFLGAAIESVLAQTYPYVELVVWDDGSTDRTLEIAHAYASRDARVRVIAAPHQGRVRSLQAAISQTRGAYLGWVDSDDRLDPKALEATIAILSSQPAIGMVYTDYWDVDSDDRVLGYGQRCHIPYSKERLLLDFMTFHFRLLRRSVFEAAGGIDDALDYVEDYDLCLRLSEVSAIHHLEQPLYYYRHHEGNASQQWRLEQVVRSQTVIQRALQRRGLDRHFELQVKLPAGRFYLRRKLHPVQARKPLWALLPQVAAVGALAFLPCMDVLVTKTAQAQSIVPAADGTNTIVTPNGSRLDISGGTRSQDGANLFQSFQQFGLTTNQIANFLATPQTRNILGRVVGGDASVINGLIQVTGGNANLYLMNPAGIIFGANASLNVPGALTVTTATGIGLNNRWFSAIGSNDYATLVGDPNAFAFTVTQPGAIVNAGTLSVGAGQRLSLLGGVVINTGALAAPGGEITIAAVPGQSLIRLNQPGSLLSFELNPLSSQPNTAAPNASLSSLPNVWTLPIASLPALLTGGSLQSATGITVNANGTVRLVAVPQQNIVVGAGTAIASGMIDASGADTGAFSTGGTVQLLGTQVGAIGATISASGATGGGNILLGGGERGQGAVPNASSTVVDSSSIVTADGLLTGSGGRVTVWSNDVTQFLGSIRARGGAQAGNGGFVEVSSKGSLAYRGVVDASAPMGTLGTVLLDPANITIVAGNGYGSADGQLPTIFSGDFPGATLTISQNALQNTAGDIILEATNDITMQSLVNGTLALTAGVTSVTFRADADGNGVGSFSMNRGDTITTSTGETSSNLAISGANLTLGTLTTAAPFANAGTITLAASGNITATAIDTTSFESGMGFGNSGGAVNVTAGGSVAVGNITTVGAQNAGSVTLVAQGNLTTGNISANVAVPLSREGGNGGAIALTSTAGSITAGSLLTTGAIQSGRVALQASSSNANITVTSIDASASQAGGLGGTVNVTAGQFVRGTGFTSANPRATITTAADSSGAITIQHGGGGLNVPFIVGNATTNGTAGAIVAGSATAPNTLSPTQSFSQGFTQGSIQILTTAPPLKPSKLPEDDPTDVLIDTSEEPPPLEAPETAATAFDDPAATEADREEEATDEFETYLDLGDEIPNTSEDAGSILSQIGAVSGVKPALVYASFVPPNVATNAVPVNRARPFVALARQGDKAGQGDKAIASSKPLAAKFSGSIEPSVKARAPLPQSRIDRRLSAQGQKEPLANGNDQLELLVVTANGKPIRRLVPGATRSRVLQVVHQFLNEVTDSRKNRTTTYLAPSQQLYRWLVAPIEPELQARGIGNLAYIADTGLRFLPLGALHDGRQFLVEKYSVGLMPSLNLTDTRYVSLKKAKVLAMGASEFTDQPPLPAVPTELSVITKDLWTGTALLNQAFTLENLKAERQQEPFQIIHLATHSEFQPGALSNSYIQLWQTKLQLNQLRQLGWNNPPVELLVLSACRTALGSDEAELGFAGFAVQAGVKSALASLWYVSDEGTLGLMTEFYRQLRSAPIKAEALRQAQIAMLKGEVQIVQGQLRTTRGGTVPLPIALADRTDDHRLSHPYYWAAFTLIGSPW